MLLSLLAYISSIVSAALALLAVRGKTTEVRKEVRDKQEVEVEYLSKRGRWTTWLVVVTLSVSVITQMIKDAEEARASEERVQQLTGLLKSSNEAIMEVRRSRTIGPLQMRLWCTVPAAKPSRQAEMGEIKAVPKQVTLKGIDIVLSSGGGDVSFSDGIFTLYDDASGYGWIECSQSEPGTIAALEDIKDRAFSVFISVPESLKDLRLTSIAPRVGNFYVQGSCEIAIKPDKAPYRSRYDGKFKTYSP